MSSFVPAISELDTTLDGVARDDLPATDPETFETHSVATSVGRADQQRPARSSGRLLKAATGSILIVGDIAAYLAAYLIIAPFVPDSAALERILAVAAMAVIVLHASSALYPGYRLLDHERLRRRMAASATVAALAVFATLLMPGGWKLALAVTGFLGIGLVIQPLTHRTARRLCRLLGLWGERAALIAGPNRIPTLMAHFTRNWQYGIRPEPFSAHEVARGNGPRIALIAGDTAPLLDELEAARRTFSEIVLLADTPNLRLAGLQPADAGGCIGLRIAGSDSATGSGTLRRALDLAVAIPATLLLGPFVLAAAAAIYAVDPGPVFFRQAREGLAGKTVRVLKLRTMYRNAEERLEALLREDPAMRAEWAAHFKLKRDPRILPLIGSLLRSTSLDEVPQLLNVIAGDMAIVGPRPFPEYHLMAMNAEFRAKRRSVMPGLTGLWQISERSNADLNLQRRLDEFYIDNRSLWFDWHILVSTIPAVFRRSGAY